MKARGIPQYTQTSVAFPSMVRTLGHPGVVDEIHVEWCATGGGCYGSGVTFRFYEYSSLGRPSYGLEITGFSDGISNVLDERIQTVLKRLQEIERANDRKSRFGHSDLAPTPAQVIDALESAGIRPSGYQLRATGTPADKVPAYVTRTES